MSTLGCAGEPSARVIREMLFPDVAIFRTNPADKAQKSSLWTWERTSMWKYRFQRKGGGRGSSSHTGISASMSQDAGEDPEGRPPRLLFTDTGLPPPAHPLPPHSGKRTKGRWEGGWESALPYKPFPV